MSYRRSTRCQRVCLILLLGLLVVGQLHSDDTRIRLAKELLLQQGRVQGLAALVLLHEDSGQQDENSCKKNRRLFLRYEPSRWESEWLDLMMANTTSQQPRRTEMQLKHKICHKMGQDSDLVQRYLKATCTSFLVNDENNNNNNNDDNELQWCKIDDLYRPIYMNLVTGMVVQQIPQQQLLGKNVTFGSAQPLNVQDVDQDVFSRFVYWDEIANATFYEYIEPLVGYLRHPLTCCETTYRYGANFRPMANPNKPNCWGWLRTTRTHFVYPYMGLREKLSCQADDAKLLYFDAGASEWGAGSGGPSLSYFSGMWQRHANMSWDAIYAYEASTNSSDFYASVPDQYRSTVHYQQVYVRSSWNATTTATDQVQGTGPFIPQEIKRLARPQDYVLFKLDIDSPGVEESNVDFLMQDPNILDYIDEFWYEFHLERGSTLAMWYGNFLTLRNRGVRAHSWI